MKSALYIGRFQPFHNGHVQVIKEILKASDRVIIVIGSGEKNFLPKNPLTAGERIEIIELALKDHKIPATKYMIIPIRNVNNYGLWVNHINIYVPPYEKLYTGSSIVKACFEGKYNKLHRESKVGPQITELKERHFNISATEVRDAIIRGQKWEHMVSKSVAKKLKEWDIKSRLENIQYLKDVTEFNNTY